MSDFTRKLETFLKPIVEHLAVDNTSCEVHWIHPNEHETNTQMSLPKDEAIHYISSMISEGFFVGVRHFSQANASRIQMVFWEEWGGEFTTERWPNSTEKPYFEAVWRGFSAKNILL